MMTPRERVRRVLAGQLPDRVPNGLGACETAGLHLLAYDKLQQVIFDWIKERMGYGTDANGSIDHKRPSGLAGIPAEGRFG